VVTDWCPVIICFLTKLLLKLLLLLLLPPGGKVGVMMAARPESVDAVCSAHPGLIRVRVLFFYSNVFA
jgi:hypothetical protein